MFVIVSTNEKSDISATECVCLSGITKIESYFDKIRVSFCSMKTRNSVDVELVANVINFTSISSLTIEFEYKQVIAIMP
jgi:hypothetical protein